MRLNPTKCKLISFTRRMQLADYSYKIDGTRLERVDEIIDLGVLLNHKMDLNVHIKYVTAYGKS